MCVRLCAHFGRDDRLVHILTPTARLLRFPRKHIDRKTHRKIQNEKTENRLFVSTGMCERRRASAHVIRCAKQLYAVLYGLFISNNGDACNSARLPVRLSVSLSLSLAKPLGLCTHIIQRVRA